MNPNDNPPAKKNTIFKSIKIIFIVLIVVMILLCSGFFLLDRRYKGNAYSLMPAPEEIRGGYALKEETPFILSELGTKPTSSLKREYITPEIKPGAFTFYVMVLVYEGVDDAQVQYYIMEKLIQEGDTPPLEDTEHSTLSNADNSILLYTIVPNTDESDDKTFAEVWQIFRKRNVCIIRSMPHSESGSCRTVNPVCVAH
jgi:hypothetical protein